MTKICGVLEFSELRRSVHSQGVEDESDHSNHRRPLRRLECVGSSEFSARVERKNPGPIRPVTLYWAAGLIVRLRTPYSAHYARNRKRFAADAARRSSRLSPHHLRFSSITSHKCNTRTRLRSLFRSLAPGVQPVVAHDFIGRLLVKVAFF